MKYVYVAPHPLRRASNRLVALLAALALLVAALPVALPVAQQVATSTAAQTPSFDALPLAFVPNHGQAGPAVAMQVRGPQGTVSFTPHEVVFALPHTNEAVRLQFAGADATPAISGVGRLPGTVNDLRGDDPQQWHTDIPTYGSIVYDDLYAGVDLRYDGADGTIKSTYTVAPGVDPGQIRWHYHGAQHVAIAVNGDLQITVAAEQILTEAAPVAWQDIAGQRVPVEVRYAMAADGTLSFALGAYNAAHPLIIDPTIAWSTYLGGEGNDPVHDIAVDGAGNVYQIGLTNSPDYPTKNAFDATFNTLFDAYIAKMSADGRTLVYATYLGGTGVDEGWSIAVDGAGNASVSGRTDSTDFPTTPSAFDRTLGDGTPCRDLSACHDIFVAKLNARGNALLYGTYLGGSSADAGLRASHIAVDSGGNAYVTGFTNSSDFPTTPGAFDRSLAIDPFTNAGGDAFVTKVNAHGTALVYSTFLGGPTTGEDGSDIAVDAAGHAYVLGFTSGEFPIKNALQPTTDGSQDLFITKLNTQGSDLVYSTYLGGNDYDYSGSIVVDQQGNAYVSGHTYSTNFPTKNAVQPMCKRCDPTAERYDAVVAKLNAQGNALVYATYLGGTEGEDAFGLAVNGAGEAYVAGFTVSSDFPTGNPTQGDAPGFDGYVAKLRTDGRALVYSTYLGGSDADFARALALDSAGNAYVAGETFSTNFPTKHALQPKNAGFSDGFVVKLSDGVRRPHVYLPLVGR